ncbi:MAG: hypothetical protein AAF219_09975 [Myxococcota bacterium]
MKTMKHRLVRDESAQLDAMDWDELGWLALRNVDSSSILLVDGNEHRLDLSLRAPLIRRFPDGHSLIVGRATPPNHDNAWLVEPDGRITGSFYLGYGVQDALVSRDYIVGTYFDEGVYGPPGPNTFGVSVFSRTGQFLYGYTQLPGSAIVDDCYCVTWHDTQTVAFYPYNPFHFVLLHLSDRKIEITSVPSSVTGFSALTTFSQTVWFHGPYGSDALLKWEIARTAWRRSANSKAISEAFHAGDSSQRNEQVAR